MQTKMSDVRRSLDDIVTMMDEVESAEQRGILDAAALRLPALTARLFLAVSRLAEIVDAQDQRIARLEKHE